MRSANKQGNKVWMYTELFYAIIPVFPTFCCSAIHFFSLYR